MNHRTKDTDIMINYLHRRKEIDKGTDCRTGEPALHMRVSGGIWETLAGDGASDDREGRP